MIKGTITDTSLKCSSRGIIIQLEILYTENEKLETIITSPIILHNESDFSKIFDICGVLSWEQMRGSSINIEKSLNKVISIANYWDSNIYMLIEQLVIDSLEPLKRLPKNS